MRRFNLMPVLLVVACGMLTYGWLLKHPRIATIVLPVSVLRYEGVTPDWGPTA